MNRLFTLEDWVRGLLELSTAELNARFAEYGSAGREIDALPFSSNRRWQFRRVSTPLLEELAVKIRGSEREAIIWDGLLGHLEHALPEYVAHDLVNRSISISMLGHSRQSNAVHWRLFDLVDEALLTLGKEIYCWEEHSTEELRNVLEKYPDYHWLLSALAHGRASSPEKSALLEEFLLRHSDSVRLMKIKKSMAYDVWPQGVGERHWGQLSSSPPPEQLEELYGTREPEVLKAIATNPRTPKEILEELTQIQKIPMANEIRRCADFNLRPAEAENED